MKKEGKDKEISSWKLSVIIVSLATFLIGLTAGKSSGDGPAIMEGTKTIMLVVSKVLPIGGIIGIISLALSTYKMLMGTPQEVVKAKVFAVQAAIGIVMCLLATVLVNRFLGGM